MKQNATHHHLLPLRATCALAAAALAPLGLGQSATSEAPLADAFDLNPVDVRGTYVPAEATRELSDKSRLGGSILELPRSVVAIDRYQIEERGAQSIQDALNYTAGVMTAAYGVDSRLDSARIRGVDPLKYQDGFQSLFGWYNNTRSDIYTLESVEVIKGPASVLYGRGALGGIVNSVSKLPREQTRREVEAQLGSHDRQQIALDATGSANADGTFLYRVVALHRDSDTQVDFVPDDATVFMPSFTWRPAAETSLTLLVNLQENKGGQTLQFLPNEGALTPGRPIPTNTFIGEPGWDRYDTQQEAYSLFFDHRVNDIFTFSANARYTSGEADYKSHWVTYGYEDPLIAEDGTVMRTIYDAPASTDAFVWNSYMSADFGSDSLSHEVTLGLDAQDVSIDTDSYYGWAAGGRIHLYEPVYGNLAPRGEIVDTPADDSNQFGIFARDQITLDNWLFSLGARHDSVETRSRGAAEPSIDASATTGDIGVMYRFDNGFSPYANWSESFEPLGTGTGLDGSVVQLDPKRGTQYELGFKLQPKNSASLFTAAVFDVVEKARPISNGVFVTQENVNLQGIEFEAKTNWRDLYLHAGYSYVDATDADGQRLVTIADHQALGWVTYQPSNERWSNFRTGVGVRYLGDRWDGTDRFKADAVTLVDAMIGYDFETFSLQLNLTNLADKEYVASTDGGRSYYGARRAINLSAKYNF